MVLLDGTGGMHDGWSWWWVFGPIMMVLFWGILISGVVSLLRRPGAGGRTEPPPDDNDALAILRRRYARGDIDRDEFEQRMADLRRSAEPGPRATPRPPAPGGGVPRGDPRRIERRVTRRGWRVGPAPARKLHPFDFGADP